MLRVALMLVVLLSWVVAADEVAMPEAASKYHAALLRRPHQTTLFERFQGAWLDQRSTEELAAFLRDEAQRNGGVSWSLLARYHLRRGQDGPALEALGKAVDAVPEDAQLRIERARVLARLLDFELAISDLEVARKGENEELALQAAKMLGQFHLRSGDSEAAVAVWNATLKANPGDEDLLEDLVDLAAAARETDQALEFMDMLLEASKDPYRKALRQMRRGDLLGAAGRFDQALEVYDKTLAAVGQGSWLEREVLAQMVRLFQRDDRTMDLKVHLAKLAEQHGGRLLLHRKLAMLEAAEGEMDAAIGRYREVLKRSPGERELRQEFVRMLVDGERVEEAVEELEKLIAQTPQDAGLWLQMAAMRHRQGKHDQTLAALEKVLLSMAGAEGAALRVAGLMLEYELEQAGVKLLRERMALDGAGPAAAEMLAAYFSRSGKQEQALELLVELSADDDLDTVLRATSAVAALGESLEAYELLRVRNDEFSGELSYLAALVQLSMAAEKAGETTEDAVRMLHLTQGGRELAQAVSLAARGMMMAKESQKWIKKLKSDGERGVAETCLLAELMEKRGDISSVDVLFEGVEDPMLVRFLAALLERRGAFDRAVETMLRLAESDEGRKASYLKELAEMQQRAGDMDGALATAERWKQRAPGDKSVWVFCARLHQDEGKLDKALRELRQAARKFEGDKDLAASLAALYGERQEYQEAEAILWGMYDRSEQASEQFRWGSRLAEMAVRGGRSAELEARLIERSRSNRKSVSPLLARAELARRMNQDYKRRDLLMEAVRLQPQDLTLRLEIAKIEEDDGEGERALAILEEAMPYDRDNRVRRALAHAYLRQGKVRKGLRQLRALAGGKAPGLRNLENMAMSLARSGMFEESITMLREGMAVESDWRIRYLLAVLLEEDGREVEALPMFYELLEARGEIDGVGSSRSAQWIDDLAAVIRPLILIEEFSGSAYEHRSSGREGLLTWDSDIYLPETDEEVHVLSMRHLLEIERTIGGAVADGVRLRLDSLGQKNTAIYRGLIGDRATSYKLNKILKEFPDDPGLITMLLLYSDDELDDVDSGVLKQALGMDQIPVDSRLLVSEAMLRAEPEDERRAIKYLSLMDESMDGELSVGMAARQIVEVLDELKLSDENVARLKGRLRDLLEKRDQDGARELSGRNRIDVELVLDLEMDAVTCLNQELVVFQRGLAGQQPFSSSGAMSNVSRYLYGGYWSSLSLEKLKQTLQSEKLLAPMELSAVPLRSLPEWLTGMVRKKVKEGRRFIDGSKLSNNLEGINSPLLKLWIALLAENDEAVELALVGEPSAHERLDFLMLSFVYQEKREEPDLEHSLELLLEASALSGADRGMKQLLDFCLVRVAEQLDKGPRSAHTSELRRVLVRLGAGVGKSSGQEMSELAKALGFDDLAKRFFPRVKKSERQGAKIKAISVSRPSKKPMEKISQLVEAGRPAAAAREARTRIRAAQSSGSLDRDDYRGLGVLLGAEGRREFLKLIDPGESKSRVKRMEFVDLCEWIGAQAERHEMLEQMLLDRPADSELAVSLIFANGVEQKRWNGLLKVALGAGGSFSSRAAEFGRELGSGHDPDAYLGFFEWMTDWLEASDPEALKDADLTWVRFLAREFFAGFPKLGLPALIERGESEVEYDPVLVERRERCAKRLLMAMPRYHSLSEAGFRLLVGWGRDDFSELQLDDYARRALIGSMATGEDGDWDDPFELSGNGGYSFWDGEFEQWSSWSWFVRRSGEVAVELLFDKAFLSDLRAYDVALAELLEQLPGVIDAESMRVYHNQIGIENLSEWVRQGLSDMLEQRASQIDGFAGEVLVGLRSLAVAPVGEEVPEESVDSCKWAMRVLALVGSVEELDAGVKEVERVFLGEDPKWVGEFGEEAERLMALTGCLDYYSWDDAVMLRLLSSYLRVGVSARLDEDDFYRPFRAGEYYKAEDVIAFIEEAGLFQDVEDWAPPGGWELEFEEKDGRQMLGMRLIFVLDQGIERLDLRGGLGVEELRQEMEKRLEQCDEGRFGRLMIMAAMESNRQKREEWVEQAFTESAVEIAALPESQMRIVSMAADWLSPEQRVKLPERMLEMMSAAENEARKTALEHADKVLEMLGSSADRLKNHFRLCNAAINQVMPYSWEKALELYIVAEAGYTESLSYGGQWSYGWSHGDEDMIAERDRALTSILAGSITAGHDPAIRLRFLVDVMEWPVGERLTLISDYWQGIHSYAVAELVADLGIVVDEGSVLDELERWELSLEMIDGLDEDLQAAAFVGVMEILLNYRTSGGVREIRRELENSDSAWADSAEAMLGGWVWGSDREGQRLATGVGLAELLSDDSISVLTRVTLADDLIEMSEEMFVKGKLLQVLVGLYEEYCGGERSAVVPFSVSVMGVVSRMADGQASEGAARRVVDAFWNNAMEPKVAGHSVMSDELSQLCLRLALIAKHESAAVILTELGPGYRGGLPLILAYLMAGEDVRAKELLSSLTVADLRTGAQSRDRDPFAVGSFLVSVTEAQAVCYSRSLEQRMAEFLPSLDDAAQRVMLELALLNLAEGVGENAPESGLKERAVALRDRFFEIESPNASLSLMVVAGLMEYLVDDQGLGAAAIDWAQDKDFSRLLMRRQMNEVETTKMAVSLFENAALADLRAGNVALLRRVVKGFEAVSGEIPSHWVKVELQEEFMNRCCLWLWGVIGRGERAGVAEGAEVLEEMLKMVLADPAMDADDVELPMVILQVMRSWVGQEEGLEWLSEPMREMLKEMIGHPALGDLLLEMDYMSSAVLESASGVREAFVLAMLTRPELAFLFPSDGEWTEDLDLKLEELVLVIGTSRWVELSPNVKPAMAGMLARDAVLRGDHKVALEWYDKALELSQGEAWKPWRKVMAKERGEVGGE